MSTSFNLNQTANISQSSIRPQLEGNKIHEVTFDGCEKADFKDGAYKVIKINFSNEVASFTHTIFEPTEADMQDQPNAFGGKQPANFISTKLLVKHLIDVVNPELAKAIDEGKKSFAPTNWESFRDLVVKATDPGKGTKTKIKLLKNKKGEAILPGFLAGYNKAGQLYMRTNCIGNNIFFTNKELEAISKAATAKPTNVGISEADPFSMPISTGETDDTFDISIDKI